MRGWRQWTSMEEDEEERKSSPSQNQFPRPRVHFINQRTDTHTHTHTRVRSGHALSWPAAKRPPASTSGRPPCCRTEPPRWQRLPHQCQDAPVSIGLRRCTSAPRIAALAPFIFTLFFSFLALQWTEEAERRAAAGRVAQCDRQSGSELRAVK